MNYIEPVYRPPSEWRSLIIQVTNGCSWNRCTFCEMYQDEQKKFNHKPLEVIAEELSKAVVAGIEVQRIFLADGDVMTLSVRRLAQILELINEHFPDIKRISAYCLPRNLRHKCVDDLKHLNDLGLKLLYVGCETGDDKLLQLVDKGESFNSSREALLKLTESGIKSSVMILNGLGGKLLSQQHAENSARLMNETQPDYLSTLVVGFPKGEKRFQHQFPQYEALSPHELFQEIQCFLQHLQLNKTIFRSDHASNYLVLKGILNRDKDKLINKVQAAIDHPELIQLRQETQRGFRFKESFCCKAINSIIC